MGFFVFVFVFTTNVVNKEITIVMYHEVTAKFLTFPNKVEKTPDCAIADCVPPTGTN